MKLQGPVSNFFSPDMVQILVIIVILVPTCQQSAVGYTKVLKLIEKGNIAENSKVIIFKNATLTSCYLQCEQTPLCMTVGYSREDSDRVLIDCYLIKENYDQGKIEAKPFYVLMNSVSPTFLI